MTVAELETLKAEIKAEILAEMRINQKTSNWSKIRTELEDKLSQFSSLERYQLTTAIATIVRNTLGVKAILKLPDDKVEKARKVAYAIVDAMNLERSVS